MRNRYALFCLASFLCVLTETICLGQEDPSARVSNQIYDVPGSILFIQSADSHESHVANALSDFFNREMGWSGYKIKTPKLIDRKKPIVYYGVEGLGDSTAVQLPLLDPTRIAGLASDPEKIAVGKPFALKEKIACDFPIFSSAKKSHGIIRGSNLIASSTRWHSPEELDTSDFDPFGGAELLSPKVDPRMSEFFDRAGFGSYMRADDVPRLFDSFAVPIVGNGRPDFTAAEKAVLGQIETGFETAKEAAGGLTYKKRQLNGEGHLKFSRADAFGEVFDFEAADKEVFKPTIGLPSDNLLLSFSAQTSMFASTDVTRTMLKAMVPTIGYYGRVQRESALFRVTGGLIADSWKDIKGMRVGLYRPTRHKFSVIAIFDAREPETFFAEVEKLVAIVEPDTEAGLSKFAAKEIQSLIEGLGANKYAVRERAETRLSMSGKRAAPALRIAVAETESAELRIRASRILTRLETMPTSAKQKLSNMNFWANIDPDFAIEKGTDSLFGLPARMIRVQLPQGLTDEQTRNATRKLEQLFGQKWDRVPLVRVGDRVVAMFGYDELGIKATIENLKHQRDPVKRVAVENAPYFKTGNVQIHASFDRIHETFVTEKDSWVDGFAGEHPKAEKLTSVSLSLATDYWQAILNMPVEEVAPMFRCQSLFNRKR